MFSRKKPDVLVVGAGPVGMFTALALSDRGVRVQIVDRAAHSSTRSYALALHAESLQLFEQAGILPQVLESSLRIRKVGLYDAKERRAEMRITELAKDHSFLTVLPQNALEKILETALAKRGVKVQWSHSVPNLVAGDDGVDVTIDRLTLDTLGYSVQHSEWVVAKTKQHHFPFVIGADGNASVVRRRLDIDFPTIGERSEFAVFECHTDADLGDELRLILADETTNVCWPMPDNCCRWSFQRGLEHAEHDAREKKDVSLVQFAGQQYPELTDDYLHELLAERAPWFKGGDLRIKWRMEVRFENRLADSFGRGRTWLVGDAGHLTGPAGIQSMNVGLREASDLAKAVSGVLQGDGSPADLDRYDEARRAEWRALLGIDRILQPTPKIDSWVEARVDRLLPCVPASGRDLVRLMEQVGFNSTAADFAGTKI